MTRTDLSGSLLAGSDGLGGDGHVAVGDDLGGLDLIVDLESSVFRASLNVPNRRDLSLCVDRDLSVGLNDQLRHGVSGCGK